MDLRERERAALGVVGAVALGVLLLAVAFVFFHTGARADGLCEERVFVGEGRFSLSHLGVRCSYGLPRHTSYERGVSFHFLAAAALTWVVAAAIAALAVVVGRRRAASR